MVLPQVNLSISGSHARSPRRTTEQNTYNCPVKPCVRIPTCSSTADNNPVSPLMDSGHFKPFLHLPLVKGFLNESCWESISAPDPRYEGHDSLWYHLLSGAGGVLAHCLLCYRPQQYSGELWRETRHLLVLGPSLTSKQGVCHGGLLAVVVDEVGIMTIRHYGLDGGMDPSTAFLNVTYKNPVAAPGIIIAVVKVSETLGRKINLSTTIMDGDGRVCVTAEMLVVTSRPRL